MGSGREGEATELLQPIRQSESGHLFFVFGFWGDFCIVVDFCEGEEASQIFNILARVGRAGTELSARLIRRAATPRSKDRGRRVVLQSDPNFAAPGAGDTRMRCVLFCM